LFGILDVYREDAQDLADVAIWFMYPIYLVVVQSNIVFVQWSVRLGGSMQLTVMLIKRFMYYSMH
jgi:hypothetical protein